MATSSASSIILEAHSCALSEFRRRFPEVVVRAEIDQKLIDAIVDHVAEYSVERVLSTMLKLAVSAMVGGNVGWLG